MASQHRETNQTGSFEAILPVLKVGDNQTLIKDWSGNLHDVHLANIYQPFPSPSHQGLFIQEFVSAFFDLLLDTRPNAWVFELPSIFTDVPPSSALICAVRAATMAHYGKRSNDVSMRTEACRWYDKGLEKQMIESRQMQLQLANGDNVEDRIGVAAICGVSFWICSNLS